MITFGNKPKVNLFFNTLRGDNLNADGLVRLIGNARPVGGEPRLGLALKMVNKEVFTEPNGMRKSAVKVFIITVLYILNLSILQCILGIL